MPTCVHAYNDACTGWAREIRRHAIDVDKPFFPLAA